MIEQGIDDRAPTIDQIDHARRQTGLRDQLDQRGASSTARAPTA